MTARTRFLALGVFVSALAFAAPPLVRGRATDFRPYLEAARALRHGHDPYALDPPYLYPPLLAVCLVPLTFVTPEAAGWLWASASAAALAGTALRVARGEARVLVLALVFAPFAATQWNLQANAWVLLLVVLARERLDAGREAGGGALLGISIALKPFGLLAAVLLAVTGRWRAALAAAGAFLACFAVVLPFGGASAAAASAGAVKRILSDAWVEPYGSNVSLNGSLDRWLPRGAGPSRHRAVGLAIAGGTMGLLAAGAAGAGRAGRRVRSSAAVDAGLAATLLGASSSWLHHATVLFPAVAALSPRVEVAAAVLFGVAAAWNAFAAWGAAAGAAASLAGTAALALVWVLASRRAVEPC